MPEDEKNPEEDNDVKQTEEENEEKPKKPEEPIKHIYERTDKEVKGVVNGETE